MDASHHGCETVAAEAGEAEGAAAGGEAVLRAGWEQTAGTNECIVIRGQSRCPTVSAHLPSTVNACTTGAICCTIE